MLCEAEIDGRRCIMATDTKLLVIADLHEARFARPARPLDAARSKGLPLNGDPMDTADLAVEVTGKEAERFSWFTRSADSERASEIVRSVRVSCRLFLNLAKAIEEIGRTAGLSRDERLNLSIDIGIPRARDRALHFLLGASEFEEASLVTAYMMPIVAADGDPAIAGERPTVVADESEPTATETSDQEHGVPRAQRDHYRNEIKTISAQRDDAIAAAVDATERASALQKLVMKFDVPGTPNQSEGAAFQQRVESRITLSDEVSALYAGIKAGEIPNLSNSANSAIVGVADALHTLWRERRAVETMLHSLDAVAKNIKYDLGESEKAALAVERAIVSTEHRCPPLVDMVRNVRKEIELALAADPTELRLEIESIRDGCARGALPDESTINNPLAKDIRQLAEALLTEDDSMTDNPGGDGRAGRNAGSTDGGT
jgi:hypothetical protein